MKIKEICQKTGLTERTIRYYIERGLIHPIAAPSAISSRTDYQFNSGHIVQLRDISTLRGYGFPIDCILEMGKNPSSINSQVEAQAKETEIQEASVRQKREIFSRIRKMAFDNISQLAENLRREQQTFSLPDLNTEVNFGRLDEIEGDIPGDGEKTLEHILYRESRKRKFLFAGFILLLVFALGICAFVWLAKQSATTIFTPISSVTFSEKWQEEGELFATLHFGKGSDLEGISCTVRFEDFPLYWAIVPGYSYMCATINAEVPLKEGRKEGIIIEGAIPSVDIARLLQDETLSRKYAVVATVQGE